MDNEVPGGAGSFTEKVYLSHEKILPAERKENGVAGRRHVPWMFRAVLKRAIRFDSASLMNSTNRRKNEMAVAGGRHEDACQGMKRREKHTLWAAG